MDFVRSLITGTVDTPYSRGCFMFDIYFPSSYPVDPPLVKIITTGNGTVRYETAIYFTTESNNSKQVIFLANQVKMQNQSVNRELGHVSVFFRVCHCSKRLASSSDWFIVYVYCDWFDVVTPMNAP